MRRKTLKVCSSSFVQVVVYYVTGLVASILCYVIVVECRSCGCSGLNHFHLPLSRKVHIVVVPDVVIGAGGVEPLQPGEVRVVVVVHYDIDVGERDVEPLHPGEVHFVVVAYYDIVLGAGGV